MTDWHTCSVDAKNGEGCGLEWRGPWTDCPGCTAQAAALAVTAPQLSDADWSYLAEWCAYVAEVTSSAAERERAATLASRIRQARETVPPTERL